MYPISQVFEIRAQLQIYIYVHVFVLMRRYLAPFRFTRSEFLLQTLENKPKIHRFWRQLVKNFFQHNKIKSFPLKKGNAGIPHTHTKNWWVFFWWTAASNFFFSGLKRCTKKLGSEQILRYHHSQHQTCFAENELEKKRATFDDTTKIT